MLRDGGFAGCWTGRRAKRRRDGDGRAACCRVELRLLWRSRRRVMVWWRRRRGACESGGARVGDRGVRGLRLWRRWWRWRWWRRRLRWLRGKLRRRLRKKRRDRIVCWQRGGGWRLPWRSDMLSRWRRVRRRAGRRLAWRWLAEVERWRRLRWWWRRHGVWRLGGEGVVSIVIRTRRVHCGRRDYHGRCGWRRNHRRRDWRRYWPWRWDLRRWRRWRRWWRRYGCGRLHQALLRWRRRRGMRLRDGGR